MKTHTRDERGAALKNLPEPVRDFASSAVITRVYFGLAKKHKLNWREIGVVSELANLALIGLEPESGIETAIHQLLPELSNAATHELVADINDRIFKEAKRRLRENILEPGPEWDETELGPKPKPGEPPVSIITIESLKKLAAEEERRGAKNPEETAKAGGPSVQNGETVAVPITKLAEAPRVPSQTGAPPTAPAKPDPYREAPE